MNPNATPPRPSRLAIAALGALLLAAALQRGWNAYSVPPLSGYDVPGHAGYIYTIVKDHRLPHPLEGWSTFHPPLYYLIASAVWWALEPLGPLAVLVGVRTIGTLAGLAAGLVTFLLVRRLGGSAAVAWVAAALVLFIPCAQMAGTMIGNEAFAAGLAALALPSLLSLQADPRNLRAAALTGALVGLAVTAKYTCLTLGGACAVCFLRRGFDRRTLGALVLCGTMATLLAGPVYLRNLRLTGSPLPMTRELDPMRRVEASMVLRPRQVRDYLSVDPGCLLRPSMYELPRGPFEFVSQNRAMTSVWGLTYASIWYDVFEIRIKGAYRQQGIRTGPLMTLLGLVPSAVMLLGFGAAGMALLRSRGRSPDAPLVVMAFLGIAMFTAFTWHAPSMAAVKGSYLLPLAVPAGAFFARGVSLLGPRLRFAVLSISTAAALAAAVIFTDALFHSTPPMHRLGILSWAGYARELDSGHILKAMAFLNRAH